MPRRGAEQQERHAAIIMTYFHPYTLNPELDTYAHVPYTGNLCRGVSSWHEAMLRWFDGCVLSEESRRHINNFLIVTRARPDAEVFEEDNTEDVQSSSGSSIPTDFRRNARRDNRIKQRVGMTYMTQDDNTNNQDSSSKNDHQPKLSGCLRGR